MSGKTDFVRRQWRASVWFFRLFPIWIALIAGLNIWSDFSGDKPFDWENVIFPAAMLAFAGAIYIFSRLIFKFVLAWVEHTERRR